MRKLGWFVAAGLGFAVAGVTLITCVGDTPVTPPLDAGNDQTAGDGAADASGCAARTVNEATGVFVNINGTDSPQCGGAATPCQTVQAGINQAKVLSKTTVYVARGTYKESINLSAGLTLEGGWDTLAGKWIPACGAELITATKLQMPDAANVVVKADFSGAATLRNLSVLGKTANPTPGESVYGVFAKSASITFESVSVSVGPGGGGNNGDAGAPGVQGGIKCATGNGADGGAGSLGVGADGGSFGATGWNPANGGTGGNNGATGNNGTCTAVCGGNEFTICKPNTLNCSASQGCTKPQAGCGGTPGTPGFGGAGGGSSVAVFGWDATFIVTGGSFAGGNGGNGGNGGAGGPGGPGGAGSVGSELCASCISGNNCASVANTTPAVGGTGGTGGPGGAGGGGAGGASFGMYAGGTGKITVVSAPLFQHGTGGAAGTPNGVAGPAGDRFPP